MKGHFFLGDAFDLDATLGDLSGSLFDSVISGIPLLNFPMSCRVALIEDLLDRVPPGRPVVQFSYGAPFFFSQPCSCLLTP
jgi:phosphatidylethanolamine/phosphatidyl-N-methylethanolamine N-methyltransferase